MSDLFRSQAQTQSETADLQYIVMRYIQTELCGVVILIDEVRRSRVPLPQEGGCPRESKFDLPGVYR